MFRSMRRFKQEMTEAECQAVLAEEKRCVLSLVGDDGYPYGVPINFIYMPEEKAIYFHCAQVGHKIDAIKANPKACFTVLHDEYQEEGDWAWHVASVICFGQMELVPTEQFIDKVRALGMRFSPSEEYVEKEIAGAINRVQILRFNIDKMSGKHICER